MTDPYIDEDNDSWAG